MCAIARGRFSRKTFAYSRPATIAPRNGPIQYTYQLSKNCATTAGPNHRAGFMAAPVKGPPIMMSREIVSPIARPPTALKEPFGSIPVP